MNGPTLDFSFLDATARGSMASKHVDERFVSDRVNARSTTDAAFERVHSLDAIDGNMHECNFKAPAVEDVRERRERDAHDE